MHIACERYNGEDASDGTKSLNVVIHLIRGNADITSKDKVSVFRCDVPPPVVLFKFNEGMHDRSYRIKYPRLIWRTIFVRPYKQVLKEKNTSLIKYYFKTL